MNDTWELEEWKESVSKVLNNKSVLEKSIESLTSMATQIERSSERLELLESLAANVAREQFLTKLDQDTRHERSETERLLQSLGLSR